MRRFVILAGIPWLASGFVCGAAAAQTVDVISPAPNIVLPNPNSVPIGQTGSLEGGAFVARANDSSAIWYNPAGLARAVESSVSATAGSFQITTVSPDILPNSGGSFQQIPASLGGLLKNAFHNEKLTAGFSVTQPVNWYQNTNSLVDIASGAGRERFTFAADSTFSRVSVGLALAYNAGTSWRVGASLSGDAVLLRQAQSVSDRLGSSTSLKSVLLTSKGDGSEVAMRLSLGGQWDASSRLKLGVLVRTPSVNIFPSGDFSSEALSQDGPASTGASFLDESARFRYKLPFEGVVGAAWVWDGGEAELNVRMSTSLSKYAVFSSTQLITVVQSSGTGNTTTTTVPFPDIVTSNRGVVNVALGGHMFLSKDKRWTLHLGFSTDASPVGADGAVFDRINLYGITLGVTGEAKLLHLVGSLGLNYQFGSSDDIVLRDLQSGGALKTTVKVSNIGIIYSLSFKF
jgi:hypothetical protein